jgi:hypothetical protein
MGAVTTSRRISKGSSALHINGTGKHMCEKSMMSATGVKPPLQELMTQDIDVTYKFQKGGTSSKAEQFLKKGKSNLANAVAQTTKNSTTSRS